MICMIPFVYLAIKSNMLSGKYFPMTCDMSFRPILFLMKANILKNMSNIPTNNINESNL